MKAAALITLLRAEIDLLTDLGERDVNGYFFVLPPETEEPMTEAFIGKGQNRMAYFKFLGDKLMDAQKAMEGGSGGPFVGVPRERR